MSHSPKGNGIFRYQGRFYVPNMDDLRIRILEKSHGSRYYIHPGSTKMYCALVEVFLLDGLKRDIAEFVAKYTNFQQVMSELQKYKFLL